LTIALFPLNIFLLPGEQLPLHIFEPRYRQLFEEAQDESFEFGLPYHERELGEHMVSICRLLKTTKVYQTGEMDVIIEAHSLADMKNFESTLPGKLYPGGEVQKRLSDDLDQEADGETLNLFRTYIEYKFGSVPSAAQLSRYQLLDIASSVALSNREKINYVRLKDEERRTLMLKRCLQYLNLLHLQESRMENGLLLN